MKQSTVPDKYEPITNDTDPIALIGYTDPIARIVEGSAYELVDSRLIKFDGSDAKIVPQKLKVEKIEATILNGITITEYATNETLMNYVPKSVLNNYITKTSFQFLSNRVGDIETILVYEVGENESTLNINVGDALLMTCVNNGTITTTMYGNVVVEKLNDVLISNYVVNSTLNNYVTGVNLVNTLYNYATKTRVDNISAVVTIIESDYITSTILATALNDSVTNTSLTTSLTPLTNKISGFNDNGTELTVTKLNGYNFYNTAGGSLSKPGPAPWIVGVKTDGATEIGWMLDFHRSHIAGNIDYTCRITCTDADTLAIPNITATGNITSANITTLTNKIVASMIMEQS